MSGGWDYLRTICIPLAALTVAVGALVPAAAQSSLPRADRHVLASPHPSSPDESPQLVDITAATGIRFNHLSAPEKKYVVESMSGGVALIDYDRDGYPDIYFTNAPSVDMALAGRRAKGALFHNNHDGTFTDVTDKAGIGYPCWAMGAVVGDYNNDGWPDLLVTCFGGVVLYRNNGDGTFTDVTAQAGLAADHGWATGAAFGDYDGDGWPDLFVARYVDLDLHDLPIFGSMKTCQYHGIDVQCGPRGLRGLPDSLYHNNGDGTFADVSSQAGVGDPDKRFGLTAVWSDFSHDGRLDLFVANDGEPNYLYRNDGNGHFTDVALEAGVSCDADGAYQANMGLALGDYLHTGRTSILITHFSDEYAALYRNDGKLSFTDDSVTSGIARATSHFVGWGDAFFDPDNDGWPDLIVVNGHVYPQVDSRDIGTRYREPKLLFRNQRDGTFRNVSDQAGPALRIPQVSRGLAVGDLFNDGHLEVVIENIEGQPMILRSQSSARNHWISFSLEGVRSNRLALNARVRVTAGDLVQEDEVRSGGSYLSQNDLRLHFGLATHSRIDKAEIFWPSGATEVLKDLASDRFYTVREGQGVVASQAPNPSPKFGAQP
jgi:enediyne biosynthesis protein E4